MKTAEDYIRQINDRFIPHPYNLSHKQREDLKSLIREIQKEAYNQAIDDATEKAKVSVFDWTNDGFKEFKQDSSHYATNDGTYVEIDEQSILKLKK